MKHTQQDLEHIANMIECNYLELSDSEWFKVVEILSNRVNRVNSAKHSNDPVPYKVRHLEFS
jgi:hypothetical protein